MKRQRIPGADSRIEFDASKLPPLPRLPDKHAQRPFLHPTFAASQLGKKHPEITKNLRSEVEFRSYEPYEFIGDRILSTFVITALKLLYPKATCGTLDRLNQLFTTNAMFAAFGYEYGFGDRILMGNGAIPPQKTVADAFEAYFGVLFYSELERTALLGLPGALGCNLTNTLFPEDANAGPSISAKAAGKKRAREESKEEDAQPFASILQYVIDLLRNAFPTLSTWINAREARRSLLPEQQLALQRSRKIRPSRPFAPNPIGRKAIQRKRKKENYRENKRRRLLDYDHSGDPADANTQRNWSDTPGRAYQTRSYLSKQDAGKANGSGTPSAWPHGKEIDIDDDEDDDDSDDDDIIFIAVKGPATAESQAALRTPIRVIDLCEDTTDDEQEEEEEGAEEEEEADDGRARKRVKYDSRSPTPYKPRSNNNDENANAKASSSKPPLIQESSDEEDEEGSRSSSGEAENISATLIQKPAQSSQKGQTAEKASSQDPLKQDVFGRGTTEQPFELSDDDDSEG